jgi:N-dimethylarginine dimethylaminohydrolase
MTNAHVLMSGVDFFDDDAPINPFMSAETPIDRGVAASEHHAIQAALEAAGVHVTRVAPPADCQDGVFTANWALVRGDKAVLARLPNARKAEEAYARSVLEEMGKTVVELPPAIERFSGQGDALPCGNYLICGSGYRTDEAAAEFVCETLGFTRVQLRAKPLLDDDGQPAVNQFSGWEDSFFYDIDLAVAVLREPIYQNGELALPGLLGVCKEALLPESVARLEALPDVELIEVSMDEAVDKLACNLVSTGTHVVMNDAPEFAAAIEAHSLTTARLSNPELAKGGGSVRCTTLTL